MRITGIRTLSLSRMHERERQWFTATYRTVKADCSIVIIQTDSELFGIGEASAYGGPAEISDWVSWLSPELVGQDLMGDFPIIHPNGLSRSHDAAISGIDCALWDLRGKTQGKKVSSLISEDASSKVALYASGGCSYDWRDDPRQLISEAQGYIDQGYQAMKFRIGTQWDWDAVTVDKFLGLVRTLAGEVNGRIKLILDGNCRLDERQAFAIAEELEKLQFVWFEEPMPRNDVGAYARLNGAFSLPISGGESFYTLEQFRPYFDNGAVDIVQPDAGICGATEFLRIAGVARRNGLRVCPHSWHNGLMMMAHAHLVAALPNAPFVERCMIQGPLQLGILKEPPRINNGILELPDTPGFGVEPAESLEERFPFIEGHYGIQVNRPSQP